MVHVVRHSVTGTHHLFLSHTGGEIPTCCVLDAESRTPVREARELALRLTDDLKALSRSDARGGSSAVRPTLDGVGVAAAAVKAERAAASGHAPSAIAEGKGTRLSPRMTRRALSEAASVLEQEGIHTLDEATFNATLGLAPPLHTQQETAGLWIGGLIWYAPLNL